MRRRRAAVLGTVAALVTTAMAAPAIAGDRDHRHGGPTHHDDRPDFSIDHEQVDALVAEIATDGVETVQGEILGAAYVGQKPDDWNGDLVVWAHGYRGEFEDAPTLTVDAPPAREWLLEQGYAWVASSYRRNSYDPGIGVRDTRNAALKAAWLFGGRHGADDVLLAGVSMGGHVVGAAIEQDRWLYDGALPACGVLGDVELFDYFLDYNLGAAAFAGLDADEVEYPDDDWVGDEVVDIKQALSQYDELGADQSQWAFDGSPVVGGADLLAGPGEDFKAFVEVGSGGERVTFDAAWDYWHVAGQGDFFFALGEGDGTVGNQPGIVGQNSDTVYAEEYAGVDGGIDDTVERVRADRFRRRAFGNWFKAAPIIRGRPSVPVLTMHTVGDLFVPIEMEQVYAREVARNGRSDLLVQRAVRDVGHCTFTRSEWVQAYGDLFAWVEDGVRPEGEDLVADISDPTLGCAWTTNDGPGGTALRPLFPCP